MKHHLTVVWTYIQMEVFAVIRKKSFSLYWKMQRALKCGCVSSFNPLNI